LAKKHSEYDIEQQCNFQSRPTLEKDKYRMK